MADAAFAEAAELTEQALDLAPDWTAAWVALGDARREAGDTAGAILAYARALALDPVDRHGASLRRASLDTAMIPAAAPPAYVGALFDAYAARFEAHLTERLAYRGPADLVAALDALGFGRFAHALDLGCGTGLAGVALHPRVDRLTGVDLSAGMVAQAAAKGLYDRLAVTDLAAFLEAEPAASADLVVAADVFVYIGDLAPVFSAVARVLRPGGVLALTGQRRQAGVAVGPDMRFAHAIAYLRETLIAAGLEPLVIRENQARREKGVEVPGYIAIARLGGGA